MYVVIFRATINQLDKEYNDLAVKLRQRAFEEYGCLKFTSCLEGDQEIALSYWSDKKAISRWANDAEHRQAQALGYKKWYKSVSVEVAKIDGIKV